MRLIQGNNNLTLFITQALTYSLTHSLTNSSCTVEMININEEYDIAVIDEGHLIGDAERGSVYTNAILGLKAKVIHVCGNNSFTNSKYFQPSPNKLTLLTHSLTHSLTYSLT